MGVAERRQREREERREQILDAAEVVFFDRGLEAATMDDVAGVAELSKGALYLYFGSKDELLTAVMNRCHEGFVGKLERIIAGEGAGITLVAAVMRAYVQFVHDYPGHTRLMLTCLASGHVCPVEVNNFEHHQELVRREVELVMGAIERGKRDGTIRGNLEAQELSMHLWGGLMGMMLLAINREQLERELLITPDMEAAVASFLTLLLRGIAANPADVEQISGAV